MKPARKTMLAMLVVFLGGCEPINDSEQIQVSTQAQSLVTQVKTWLPGAYSNYAQVYEDQSDQPATDLNIRQLKTNDETVFLFESEQRQSDVSNHEIYWLKTNPTTQKPELHFAYLTEDDISLPVSKVLTIAWQRVNPGCVIELVQTDDQLNGNTNPDSCLFDHLLQGETRLQRNLTLNADSLTIENTLAAPTGLDSTEHDILKLQKHRVFEGWASSRTPAGPDQELPGPWHLSNIFSIRDDGRTHNIRDQEMASIGFGLQLAKLKWIEEKPQHMRLSIINMETGGIQAYTWFDPESKSFELNFDWFQTNLELKQNETGVSE